MPLVGKIAEQRLSLLLDKPWFLPTIICVLLNFLGIFGSIGLEYVPLDYSLSINEPRQQAILSIMASSLMTLISVTFSISMLILSTVSTQFGPRLLPNFIHSKITQYTLGFFLGTFIFCLFCIFYAADERVRGIQTIYAFVLTISCLFVLVFFINTVISSIKIDGILAFVVSETKKAIQAAFANTNNNEFSAVKPEQPILINVLKAEKSGYVQGIDYQIIKKTALQHKLFITIHIKPGDYVYKSESIMDVFSNQRHLEDNYSQALENSFHIIQMRLLNQDVEFGFEQISEIAVRALSPGINDPYTARECIYLLGKLILIVEQYENIENHVVCYENSPIIKYKPYSYNGIVDAAFNRIRQAATKDITVIIAFYDMILQITSLLQTQKLINAILIQGKALYEIIDRNKLSQYDKKAITEREDKFTVLLKENNL